MAIIKVKENKADKEREWRDNELLRTDIFMVIPDSPIDYTEYRAKLREYPNQPDFPNGERPTYELS